MKWLHRLLNPHCTHCIEERLHEEELAKENKVCQSCETYKEQLVIANHEKKVLLDRLLHVPSPVVDAPPMEMSKPQIVPWRIRQQMLEAEDRKKAQLLKDAPKPQAPVDASDLEKEIIEAEIRREKPHGA